MMVNILGDTKYMFYVLFHPFDGFYEMKFRGRKNYAAATSIILLYGIVGILNYQYTGFILNNNPLFAMNSITIILTTVFPLFLFLISNWSITTLFNGKGTMGDIYLVISHALIPKIIFDIIGIVLSNFIIMEEVPLLNSFVAIGTIWFCFILFCGLCVVHEYSVFTNIVTLLSSFVSALIIISLFMLYFTLMSRIFGFFSTVFNELMKRW